MSKDLSIGGKSVSALFRAPELDIFAWKNVIIYMWRGEATPELLVKLAAIVEARWREVGQLSCVNIVQKMFALPNDEQRQAFKKMSAKTSGKYATVVVVLEGEGFLFSAARGLVTGLLVVTRQQFTVHIASGLEEVVRWLPEKHATLTGVTLDPAELRYALTTASA